MRQIRWLEQHRFEWNHLMRRFAFLNKALERQRRVCSCRFRSRRSGTLRFISDRCQRGEKPAGAPKNPQARPAGLPKKDPAAEAAGQGKGRLHVWETQGPQGPFPATWAGILVPDAAGSAAGWNRIGRPDPMVRCETVPTTIDLGCHAAAASPTWLPNHAETR
jgi:hypothetical protein